MQEALSMAAPSRTPASAWIEAGLRALATGGPDAVRVDQLAKALGTTRGSFYWHFADRDALLTALLDTWERAAIDEVIERVESRGGDIRARLRRAGTLTFSERLLPIDAAGRSTTPPLPSACAALTTAGWITCGPCSALSVSAPTRSRPGPCWPSPC
jgi:AcrR family transcriptional regulator